MNSSTLAKVVWLSCVILSLILILGLIGVHSSEIGKEISYQKSGVEELWIEVEDEYQRRADLILNLVATRREMYGACLDTTV